MRNNTKMFLIVLIVSAFLLQSCGRYHSRGSASTAVAIVTLFGAFLSFMLFASLIEAEHKAVYHSARYRKKVTYHYRDYRVEARPLRYKSKEYRKIRKRVWKRGRLIQDTVEYVRTEKVRERPRRRR